MQTMMSYMLMKMEHILINIPIIGNIYEIEDVLDYRMIW